MLRSYRRVVKRLLRLLTQETGASRAKISAMRREWGPWIKNRKWDEFEKVAKADPSQELANTVSELVLGFPEKADRKALKKVLYLLAQSGYHPEEPEEPARPVDSAPARERYRRGYMACADVLGEAVFGFGEELDDRVGWLVTHIHELHGCAGAEQMESSVEGADAQFARIGKSAPKDLLFVEIPVEYAKYRIRRSLEGHATPKAVAFWRTRLLDAVEVAHPALDLPRAELDSDGLRRVALAQYQIIAWTIERGQALPGLARISEAIKGVPEGDEEERGKAVGQAIRDATSSVINDALIADHKMRLLDLAYALHLKGSSEAGEVLAVYDDLVELGPSSAYSVALLERTVYMIVDEARRRAPGMRRMTSS